MPTRATHIQYICCNEEKSGQYPQKYWFASKYRNPIEAYLREDHAFLMVQFKLFESQFKVECVQLQRIDQDYLAFKIKDQEMEHFKGYFHIPQYCKKNQIELRLTNFKSSDNNFGEEFQLLTIAIPKRPKIMEVAAAATCAKKANLVTTEE